MAKQCKTLFLLLSISYLFSSGLTAATTAETSKKALNFIKLSCKSTKYSDVCVRSLSTYANTIKTSPQRLVKTALAVTLNYAGNTKDGWDLSKNHRFQTLQDCAPSCDINKIVYSLTKSVQELKLSESASGRSQFLFHMSKAQAWVSLASDECDGDDHNVENTCSGRFSAKMKSLKTRTVDLSKETSNVISLFQAFAKN